MWWSAGIDHRGRIYFKSDILSPQNSLIERHCLRFHEAKPLDDEGIRQVKIALGASMLGTKISIKEREEYGHKNWERCIEYGKDLFGHRWEYVNDADEWQYFAQLCAGLKRYQESGTWDVPLYFDATCSAVQWWSMLTNDVDAMRLSNLLPATEEDKPFDAYSEVKEVVKTLFTENKDELKALDELSFKEIEHVKQIIDMRPCLKESLMTGAYGSALPTRIKAIQKLLDEAGYEFNRKEVTAAGKLINTAMFKRFEIFSGGKFVRSLVRKHLKGLLDQYIKDNKIEAFDEFVFIVENDTDSELDEEQLKTRKNHIFEFNNEKTSEARKQELQELLFDEEDECTNAKNLKRLKPRESRKVARMWKCDGLCERSFYRWEKLAYERKKFYAQIAHRAKLDVSWTTPDEFRVHVTEKLEAQPEQVTMGTLPSVKVKFDIHGTVDINALARAASPSFIHSLDSTLLRMVILDLNCDVVPIHDCLGIHPSMVGALRKSLAANMYKIVGDDGRDVLKKFAKDITGNQGDWDDIDQNFPAPSLDLEETLKGAIYAWN
jgi:DNA-directed RNA polymerase